MHERIRDKLLATWGHFVAAHPIVTLTVCLPLAAGCVLLTARYLEFHSDRSKLIDPEKDWNQQYAEYKRNFPRYHDVVVVLDGEPGDQAVDELARAIAFRLAQDPRFDAADAGFDVATAGPKFFTLGPAEQFAEALDQLAGARDVADAQNANAALGALLAPLSEQEGDPEALDRLDQFLAPYLAATQGEPIDFGFLDPKQSRWQPFASRDGTGRLRFVRVHLAEGSGGPGRTLSELRERVGRIVAASSTPDVEWGVSGIPAIESDETSQAIHDSTVASLLAISLITLVMFVAFRGLTVPLLAAGALLVGMAWSFGWLLLSVGHLQLLSVVFSVILLGMGVDFALLFVSRLELVQDEHDSLSSATSRVYRRMGPGMVTGAVTTAVAFAVTAFTDFKGMAEMGTIAAGGIVLCLIAVLSVFPALLALTPKWKQIIRHRPGGETAPFAWGKLNFIDAYPVPTLVVAGLAVAALVWMALGVRYDPNILNLQSAGVESVRWEKRMVEEDARSVWSAAVLSSPPLSPLLVGRLRGAEGVSGVGGMGTLFPPDLDSRRAQINELRERRLPPLQAEPGMSGLLPQLATVRAGLLMRADEVPPDIRSRLGAVAQRIADAIGAAQRLDAAQQADAWSRLNAAFLAARDALAVWIEEALADRPAGAEDLPPVLREMWVGTDGSWLLQVYPEADSEQRSILHPDRLPGFVASMRTALAGTDVSVIGAPVQIHESSVLIKTEYIKAAVFATAAILILLLLDFRRLADALCAMAPVTVGFVGAFGLMGILGVPLNFANIITLPILVGIGVTAGVHVVHRWRAEPFGRPKGLSGGTGRGITLTMLTTMIGFGCLLLAEHRGIRSLGFVMVIGLGVTLLACYTVLPAVLRLQTRAALQFADEEGREILRNGREVKPRAPEVESKKAVAKT